MYTRQMQPAARGLSPESLWKEPDRFWQENMTTDATDCSLIQKAL